MPRKIRYIYPGLPHHIIQRGNNRQKVFLKSEDKLFFLRHLKKSAEENEVKIGAYCLMTNHFHLLIYPEFVEGLIKFVKSISQIYSQRFNKKYKRSGKVWENRYKMNILDPEYEWVFARYIENNPVRARMVKEAEFYPYSSAACNLKGSKNNIISADIIKNRREEYVTFFNEIKSKEDDNLNLIRKVVQQQKAFGKEEFIERVNGKFKTNFQVRKRGRPFTLNGEKNVTWIKK